MATETENLMLLLARMRDSAALLNRAEEAVTSASEYIETDDVELLIGVAARSVDRLIGRLEMATGAVDVGEGIEMVQLDAGELCEGLPTMLKAMAADENADLRRARAGFDHADFEAR
jgi:hypothetical protein